MRSRIARLILALAASGLLVLVVVAALVVAYGAGDQARPADAIVVLGGGAATDRRATHGAALYHTGLAPFIVCTGATVPGDTISEAERCARAVRQQGVPEHAILLEENSRSTEENAIEVAALARTRGWERVLVVSDNYHLLRARWMFSREGLDVLTSPAQATAGRLALSEWIPAIWREVLALGWFTVKTLLGLPYTDVKGL